MDNIGFFDQFPFGLPFDIKEINNQDGGPENFSY